MVPRFSAIYDLFGNGRTALKVSANRYRVQMGVSLLASVLHQSGERHAFVAGRQRRFDPQVTELGPSTGFNLRTVNRFGDDLNGRRPPNACRERAAGSGAWS